MTPTKIAVAVRSTIPEDNSEINEFLFKLLEYQTEQLNKEIEELKAAEIEEAARPMIWTPGQTEIYTGQQQIYTGV